MKSHISIRAAGTLLLLLFFIAPLVPASTAQHPIHLTASRSSAPQLHRFYLGLDTNLYPGDALLPALRKQFDYLGYWLNIPPGADHNEWVGKRAAVLKAGFGFLILYNARLDKQLRRNDPAALGATDGAEAAHAAKTEGFPPNAILFLDLEEGGRMLPEQLAYIGAWMHAVRAHGYRVGVYCAGIPFRDSGLTLTTADDIVAHFPGTAIWVANDQCPPAPGCVARAVRPSQSGFPHALVWQFSQSPRRRQFTRACAQTYAADGNCYPPGLPHNEHTQVDLDTSTSPDPSQGR
jgi:hypothetical protein